MSKNPGGVPYLVTIIGLLPSDDDSQGIKEYQVVSKSKQITPDGRIFRSIKADALDTIEEKLPKEFKNISQGVKVCWACLVLGPVQGVSSENVVDAAANALYKWLHNLDSAPGEGTVTIFGFFKKDEKRAKDYIKRKFISKSGADDADGKDSAGVKNDCGSDGSTHHDAPAGADRVADLDDTVTNSDQTLEANDDNPVAPEEGTFSNPITLVADDSPEPTTQRASAQH